MSSLWHRIGADPDLTDAVRAAVAREDALDLLWWAEHPGRPTPAGTPDPGTGLEQDRRALYRQAAPGGDPRAVAEAIDLHAAELRRAVAAARAAVAAQEDLAPVRPAVLADPSAADAAVQERRPSATAGIGAAVGRRPRASLLLAAGVALMVGVAIGGLAFGSTPRAPHPTATVRALRVFERAQRPALDVPREADAVPSILDPGSVRRLRDFSSVGTTFYAARTEDGRICVFVLVLAAPSPPACTSREAFGEGGLTLIVRASADPVDDSGTRPVDELDLSWNPDDTVSITPAPAGTASPAPSSR